MAKGTRRIAVLTADDDCPGMNAATRGTVRMALHHGWQVWGVRQGFSGLERDDLISLDSRAVSHIIERGGTFLGTSHSRSVQQPEPLARVLGNLRARGIEALVAIGGREAMAGARALCEAGLPAVGVPASIENDLPGTDVSIGVDTALNTALDGIDRIQDTALAQRQAFVIEVAGRRSGYLALMAGLAGGAEVTCIPEAPLTLEQVAQRTAEADARGKGHCVIIVAEACEPNAHSIRAYLSEHRAQTGFEAYLTVLVHMQRGGSPTAKDRFLATRLGAAAVETLARGASDVMVGVREGHIVHTALAEAALGRRDLDLSYLKLAATMAL